MASLDCVTLEYVPKKVVLWSEEISLCMSKMGHSTNNSWWRRERISGCSLCLWDWKRRMAPIVYWPF